MFDKIDIRKMLLDRQKEVEKWIKYPYWKNVHGLHEKQYLQDLFRVEAFDNFKENVLNNRLFFCHPDKWIKDDRLDSILLRLRVILPDGTDVGQGYYKDTFCQCWSKKDSMKMWEEYGKDKNKIYIKMVTNLDNLMRALDDSTQFKGYSSSFWAGVVNYCDFDETMLPIHLKSEDEARIFFDSGLISQLYLEKRSSYDFEEEVRFINFNRKDQDGQDYAFVKLKKNFSNVLTGIIIDPRLKNDEHIKMITAFAENKKIKILKSNS